MIEMAHIASFSVVFLLLSLTEASAEAPTVTAKIESHNMYVQSDSEMSLQCRVTTTGDESVSGSWYFNNTLVDKTSGPVHVVRSYDRITLTIEKFGDGNQGSYECVARSGVGIEDRAETELVVALTVLSEITQRSGSEDFGELNCKVKSTFPATFTWKFKNRTLIPDNDKYNIQGNKLIIRDLTQSDDDRYLCHISVPKTKETKDFLIRFLVIHKKVENVTIILDPKDPVVGKRVNITCDAMGIPEPTYVIKKDDDIFNKTLIIDQLDWAHRGTYRCVATNVINSVEVKVVLVPIIPAKITFFTKTEVTQAGQQFVLKCTARGYPIPEVGWSKQNQSNAIFLNEKKNGSDDVPIKISMIKFEAVSHTNDGTKFTCKANNYKDMFDSREYMMNVQYKPIFEPKHNKDEVYGWRMQRSEIPCRAKANPPADIVWLYSYINEIDDSVVIEKNNPPYELGPMERHPREKLSSRYLYINVEDDETIYEKIYHCRASNKQGDTTHNVKLKKAMPPEKPEVKVNLKLAHYMELLISLPKNNGRKVLRYEIDYHVSGQKLQNNLTVNETGQQTVAVLRNLTRSTLYMISVRAVNIVGRGVGELQQHKTPHFSAPVPINITSPRESSSYTGYLLEWEDPDDCGSHITEFTIRYKQCQVNASLPAKSWDVLEFVDSTWAEQGWKHSLEAPVRKHALHSLKRDSFYLVNMTAKNKLGESRPTKFIFKTSSAAALATKFMTILVGTCLNWLNKLFQG